MAQKKQNSLLMNLVAGGGAGAMESSICHPLDTVKTRLQLARSIGRSAGMVGTAKRIINNEGFFALYKGLTAVVSGIIPKMAIRFSSFEMYKQWMADANGKNTTGQVFLAGLGSGITEAVAVVTPMEVVKIRLQAQTNSLSDPSDWGKRKYRGTLHCAVSIVREEGVTALYKGVIPTVLRQATNQAANFTAYQEIKKRWVAARGGQDLAPYQNFLVGGISGAMGPCANCPLDVIKTRLQKQKIVPGQKPKYDGVVGCITVMLREEGPRAFYKGLTPRLMRIVPGQAITFMTYEAISKQLVKYPMFQPKAAPTTV
eukprot:comp10420_c0_seq1/m.5189 comp10420_c0_seq1/g.5189  ORF comp10420_c0_seq1/g.5189 comp10420_c0_seq1/m.5189 type:complete len:314 (-) comp10420_c0_seq1:466-1407(-)